MIHNINVVDIKELFEVSNPCAVSSRHPITSVINDLGQ